MIRIGSLFITFCLFNTLSCHKSPPSLSARENPVAQATAYIDQGDYDTAIELLEEAIKKKDSSEARLVLASAYAGRAGVKVENYWDYLIGFDAFAKDRKVETFPDVIPMNLLPEKIEEKDKKMIQMWNSQIKDLQRLQRQAEKIPVVDPAQYSGLMRARILLEKVNSASSRLYRSVLTAVIVKSETSEGEKILETWSGKNFDLCFPIVPMVSVWISKVLNLVSDGLNDLGRAYPDENETYQKMRKDIENGLLSSEDLTSLKANLESLCQLVP